jgi:hypothetical protein
MPEQQTLLLGNMNDRQIFSPSQGAHMSSYIDPRSEEVA